MQPFPIPTVAFPIPENRTTNTEHLNIENDSRNLFPLHSSSSGVKRYSSAFLSYILQDSYDYAHHLFTSVLHLLPLSRIDPYSTLHDTFRKQNRGKRK
ncbi:hypothetical protein AVEN_99188-1 [Araneus ventricosus]|uniref:Uncharacterized protein n=1 Tax=Araneus ventricosus TaxID=182803 RepID=A0A4Y2CI15_ARAVE|nr:hypothetical protein AVEN_99188-1 [Araneus ventricosus]